MDARRNIFREPTPPTISLRYFANGINGTRSFGEPAALVVVPAFLARAYRRPSSTIYTDRKWMYITWNTALYIAVGVRIREYTESDSLVTIVLARMNAERYRGTLLLSYFLPCSYPLHIPENYPEMATSRSLSLSLSAQGEPLSDPVTIFRASIFWIRPRFESQSGGPSGFRSRRLE